MKVQICPARCCPDPSIYLQHSTGPVTHEITQTFLPRPHTIVGSLNTTTCTYAEESIAHHSLMHSSYSSLHGSLCQSRNCVPSLPSISELSKGALQTSCGHIFGHACSVVSHDPHYLQQLWRTHAGSFKAGDNFRC